MIPFKQFSSSDVLSLVMYHEAEKAGHLHSASVLPIRALPLAPSPALPAASLSQTAQTESVVLSSLHLQRGKAARKEQRSFSVEKSIGCVRDSEEITC